MRKARILRDKLKQEVPDKLALIDFLPGGELNVVSETETQCEISIDGNVTIVVNKRFIEFLDTEAEPDKEA